MNVGSLFAGIGGFDLGLERAGMHTVWQVEQEPFRRAVLARHFPDAQRFEDVRDVGAHNLQWVDVICGGFPCQDISSAGAKVGIGGARSSLWAEYARIVGELRPRYVLVENVAALLTRGLGVVLGDLAALGYDAEWDCLPASAFGAPHRRDRLWLVAYPDEHGEPHGAVDAEAPRHEGTTGRRDEVAYAARNGEAGSPSAAGTKRERIGTSRQPAREVGHPDIASPDAYAPASGEREATSESGWWSVEPNVGRVADGVPARVDRLSALGDALVPQIAEWIGARILSHEQAVQKEAA